jgi:hypothetical protein
MNPQLVELVKKAVGHLPNWMTTIMGALLGVIQWNQLYTLEAVEVFIQSINSDNTYSFCIALLSVAGGAKLYSDKKEKVAS